jgi:Flp pilus assembly secretin CpaC
MGARYEIPVPELTRVAVGNPDIVEVKVVGEETLRVEPVSAGTTPMLVWTRDGSRRVYTVSVRPR